MAGDAVRSSFLQSSVLVVGCMFVGIVLTTWADGLSSYMLLAAPVAIAVAFVLGPVDNHLAAMIAATRFRFALKLVSVLS